MKKLRLKLVDDVIKRRVINLTKVCLVFRSRGLDPEKQTEMYHHEERRGEQGDETTDEFAGTERGRGGSRSVSISFKYRPLHRWQTCDQRAG